MNIQFNSLSNRPLRQLDKLIFNHMDAWGVTAVIVATALSIHQLISAKTIFLLTIITLTYWFGFAINDFYDRKHDLIEPQKAARNYFIQTSFPPTLFHIFLLIITVSLLFAFYQFGWRGILMFAGGFFIAWAYSAPPFRLKSRPLVDLITHGLFVESFPYLLVLFILNVQWQAIDVVILSSLFFASVASQLEQQARDFGVDSQSDTNFTVRFGLGWNRPLMILSTSFLISTICYGLFSGIIPLIYSPFAAIMLPLLIHRFIRGSQPRSEQWVKILTAVAIVYAIFLVIQTGLSQ
ncbi:MAG: UbiA family prenyltransferase [Chloroflexota bacterium]